MRLIEVLSEGGAQGTSFNSIAAVRKSVRYWGIKRRGADMAGTPACDPKQPWRQNATVLWLS